MQAGRDYFRRLQRSFEALYACLEKPRTARQTVVLFLTIHSALLAYSAYVHSPTLNEPGHLAAGLSNWRLGKFDIYSVNPPFVRMVAALPVMAVGYEEDLSGYYSGPGARPEFVMGEDFAAANGERSFFLFMIARWACIPFSWVGGIVCYLWARDLYGRPAGVVACSIWCFEPNILAHASLMTPDAHATALGLAACYTFWRWLKKPTWSQAALTGAVLGLAELTKTTLILFYPLWPLMWVLYRWRDRRSTPWIREAGMLVLRMTIGLYVLNLGYGFEGSFTQLKNYHFVSNLLTSSTARKNVDLKSSNRFADTWLGTLPVPLPKNYLLGVDIQQSDFENYGRPSYLRGEWRDHGWWYYYLFAVAIKVPLGLWLLGLLAIISRSKLSRRRERSALSQLTANGRQPTASLRDEFILLFPAATIVLVVSSKTGFSEHMRYVLPAFPFFFVAISGNCLKTMGRTYAAAKLRRRVDRSPLLLAKLVALCWLVASSLSIYPHSLSYFNEAIGGPIGGPIFLSGSNVDWGQDLIYAITAAERRLQDGVNPRTATGKPGKLVSLLGRFIPQWDLECVSKEHLGARVYSRRPVPPEMRLQQPYCVNGNAATASESQCELTTYAVETLYLDRIE